MICKIFRKFNFLTRVSFKTFAILLSFFFSTFFATQLYAQSLNQKLEWKSDPNVFEYKVQVRSVETGKVYDFATDSNFIEFSLPAGNYEWKVNPVDFLGRVQEKGNWQKFEIRPMVQPEIKKVSKKVVVDVSESGNHMTEIPLESYGVERDATVELVNAKNGKSVKGIIENDTAVFPKVNEGEWKLRVTNKSGLEAESEPIAITDSAAEEKRLAAEQAAEEKRLAEERAAEEKRIAAEQAAEEKRLAAEQAASEKAARDEEKRLAAERAAEEKRLAAEQAASEKAARDEEKRLAAEQAAAEKAARDEEKRLAAERAAEEKAAREAELAKLEQEKAEQEVKLAEEKRKAEQEAKDAKKAKKLAKKNRPEKNFVGVYWTLGTGSTMDKDCFTSFFSCLRQLDFSDYPEPSLLSLFSDYSNPELKQYLITPSGELLKYPFVGAFADGGYLHSYDTKLEWMPWKFVGFEAGFGLEFSPTLVTAYLGYDEWSTYKAYYQMEFYPVSANVQLLIPIVKKMSYLGLKAGGGMLLTHAYEIAYYENVPTAIADIDSLSSVDSIDVESVSGGIKYGETYFINYMLTAGAFIRAVSYHGFVFDFGMDYVYWNISDFSISNILANFMIGFKI